MNILFELRHPRHYYQFKAIYDILKERGHLVKIIATERTLLIDILRESKEEFILLKHTKSGSIALKLLSYFIYFNIVVKTVKEYNINLLISKASISSCFLKVIKPNLESVIFPDSEDVWLTNNYVRFFSDLIILPSIFPLKWSPQKVLRIKGTCENCYLDPKYFQPKKIIPSEYGYQEGSKFVFFRFVAWKAHHDKGQYGFSKSERKDIVKLFIQYDYIPLISFEDKPDEDLEQYINRFPKNEIRSVLTLCDYFVGDSQSMAAEAALLGVKSFRYNSWVLNDVINFKFFNQQQLLLNFSNYNELKATLIDSLEGKLNFFKPISDYWEKCGDVNTYICDEIEKRFIK